MTPFQLTLLVFVLLSRVSQVFCGSYWAELTTERIGRNRIAEYCTCREGLPLFPGSKVKFRDSCFECTCTRKDGLSCKTPYGMMLFGYSECKTVIDDCQPLLVDKYNERLRCFSKIPTDKKVPKKGYKEITVNSVFG